MKLMCIRVFILLKPNKMQVKHLLNIYSLSFGLINFRTNHKKLFDIIETSVISHASLNAIQNINNFKEL